MILTYPLSLSLIALFLSSFNEANALTLRELCYVGEKIVVTPTS